MSLILDHIVIAVHDLEPAIADYAALGFNVLRGGEHPGRSTHNALVVFADGSYFELIAWREPAPQERWWQLLQAHGEGLVDFALLPQDTATTVREAGQRGLQLLGPLDGGRVRPDGERLHWQTARAPSPDLPFLCGDLTPRVLRVPEGDARVHPNGAQGVASLAIAVHDLEASLERYRALLGDKATVGQPVTLPGGDIHLAVVNLGASALLLTAPRHAVGHPARPLAQRLGTRGQGPSGLVLRTADAGQRSGPLDLARTHGALLEFELAESEFLNKSASSPREIGAGRSQNGSAVGG
ncbi:VOC family protein [uncultured Ramlibacter sp.]|uniref:VOC family protein n=1 Tax=uncultured Ramlibacter sp. TaxID=260755 RepID=UPI00263567B8|nr:VOC family protein [uncultured Ramlibacter sp.]